MLIQADARKIPLADGCVQCVVTSPPYWGLRDYSAGGQLGLEKTPEEYVTNMVAVFREVWRVLKPDGTIWVNLGDSYWASQAVESRQPSEATEAVRGYDGNFQRKLKRNTGINHKRDAVGLKPKDLCGIPWRIAFALQADGWYLRSDIIWAKPNPMPESVTDRPTKAHEYLFLMAKSEKYFYDADAIREPHLEPERSGTIENRIMAKGNDGISHPGWKHTERIYNPNGRNRRTVWTIPTQAYSGAHFATFPEKLVEPCILAGSRPGDIVFDPFVGSGTVIRVATRHQRKGVGCDISYSYLYIQAKNRIRKVQVKMFF